MTAPRPLAVLIGALGGQGGGLLADWLTEAARLARMIEVVPAKEWTKQLPKILRALQTLRNTFDAYKANLVR